MTTQKTCKRRHNLVRVWWVDAEQSAGWTEDKDVPEKHLATYGLLIRNDKLWVRLADTHNPDSDTWGGLNKIPRSLVRKIEIIERSAPCEH